MPIPSEPITVDAELIHNWSQRYIHLTRGTLYELPQQYRAELMRAHLRHHRDGADATDEARKLAEKYPAVFVLHTNA